MSFFLPFVAGWAFGIFMQGLIWLSTVAYRSAASRTKTKALAAYTPAKPEASEEIEIDQEIRSWEDQPREQFLERYDGDHSRWLAWGFTTEWDEAWNNGDLGQLLDLLDAAEAAIEYELMLEGEKASRENDTKIDLP